MNRTVALPDPVWLDLRDRLAGATLTEAERLDGPALDRARLVIDAILADFGVIQATYEPLAELLEEMRQQAEADQVIRDLITQHLDQMTGSDHTREDRVIYIGKARDGGEQ